MIISLSEMNEDETGSLHSLDQDILEFGFVKDLLDYGFFPGTKIRVIHKFQNQSKITVAIGPVEIALRLTDAEHIRVESHHS